LSGGTADLELTNTRVADVEVAAGVRELQVGGSPAQFGGDFLHLTGVGEHSRGDVEVEVREVALGADPAGPEREATGEFPIELLGQGDRHFLVPVAAPAEADVVEGALVRRDEGVSGGCPVPRVGICGGNGKVRLGDVAERDVNIGAAGVHVK